MQSLKAGIAVKAVLFASALALVVPQAFAQADAAAEKTIDWKTTETLPEIDMNTLDAAQKATALKILREEGCTCGCGMKIAQCRIEDRNCPRSPGLGAEVVQMIKAGKSEADVRAGIAKAAPPAAAAQPQAPPPTLDAMVEIPVTGAPVKGPATAKVTIVEFSDFQCPYCSKAIPWVESILKAYPNDVKVIFKQYPLPFHKDAKPAAEAALAAHAQGKFWEMHDKLFENYRTLSRENYEKWGTELGLDMDKFKKALDEGTFAKVVDQDMADGAKVGVRGTPSFYLNGQKYNGGRTLEAIKPMIDAALKGGGAATTAPAKAGG